MERQVFRGFHRAGKRDGLCHFGFVLTLWHAVGVRLEKEALQYRRLERRDLKSLCELFYEVFGDGKGTDYWEWKYFRNPFGEHASIIALARDRVVGVLGGVPVQIQVGNEVFLVCQGVDTVLAPDYRRSSVFFRLEKLVAAEMARCGFTFR